MRHGLEVGNCEAVLEGSSVVRVEEEAGRVQDGGQPHNFHPLNRYNSAADCSTSIKCGTEFDHVTADTLQVYIQGQKERRARCRAASSCNASQLIATFSSCICFAFLTSSHRFAFYFVKTMRLRIHLPSYQFFD